MLHRTATLGAEPPTSRGRRTDTGEAEFLEIRPRLLAIARRVLGDPGEAEDVVQEAWMRWHGCDRASVTSPRAFLTTATRRLAINAATSARARRETSASSWFPEVVDPAGDPSLGAERRDSLEDAIRMLLERLAPAECAAYVLRHVFDLPYAEIAELLGVSVANARQIVSRAGGHIETAGRRRVAGDEQRHVVETFVGAARRGEVRGLTVLLTGDRATPTLDAAA